MKLSLINKLINPVWVEKKVKVGNIIKYETPSLLYYCRVIEISNGHCHGHFVKDLKDIDTKPGLNDGMVRIEYVRVLK